MNAFDQIKHHLRNIPDVCYIIYFDEVLISDPEGNLEEHHEHVKAVLGTMRNAQLKANLAGCEFDVVGGPSGNAKEDGDAG